MTDQKPILLDLFCGAGGAAEGYARNGFEVIGVDINPQPHFPYQFIQADWAEPLAYLPGLWEREGRPYAIHASPPCQAYSTMTAKWGRQHEHPDLVAPVQEALYELDVPFVIENVPGAPLRDPVMLCGTMFRLEAMFDGRIYGLQRHRNFESNVWFWAPAQCHHVHQPLPVYGHAGGRSTRDGLRFPDTKAWKEGMGIDWMNGKELAESIPPAYTEHIGWFVMKSLLSGNLGK
jgi:DNA (cytosine-5)-methyltransferase 1